MDLHALLGDDADGLLNHTAKGIPKDDLLLPGPDFLDRAIVPTDRSPVVLRNLASMNGNDELKLVIGSREDYEWARQMVHEHRLLERPYGVLFSTVFGAVHPRELAEWIIADRLAVRFQLQQHKYLWDPQARGV